MKEANYPDQEKLIQSIDIELIKDLFKRIDTDNSGFIDLDEFKAFLPLLIKN